MTSNRSPLGRALDVFVFAPVGVAVTVVEDLPELADKGRQRLVQPLEAFRGLGDLAVAEGRRRFGMVDSEPQGPTAGGGASSNGSSAGRQRAATGASASAAARVHDDRYWRPEAASNQPAAREDPGPVTAAEKEPTGPTGVVDAHGSADEELLAIPGYDSLSAPQVVQRLESLTATELEAVRLYESANRRRRTILARVAQLQQG